MKIKVCDALCGAGKTVSCINMMNMREDVKFIFVTPYLDEVERIKKRCPNRHFISPEKNYSNGFSKLADLHALLDKGENIASTHSLFSYYTDETKELLRQHNYVLVLDEVLNIFQETDISPSDMNILYRSKTITGDDNEIRWNDNDYQEGFYEEVMFKSKSNNLIKYDNNFYFWAVPQDIFSCFEEVYILTYMFEYQMQKYFFDIYNMDYELIGVKREDNSYTFCPLNEMDRRVDLTKKIHIIESEKLNEVGETRGSLSLGWYDRSDKTKNKTGIVTIKNNLYNIFHNIFKGNIDEKMWTVFKKYYTTVRGKGYSNGFLACNMRASNEYRNKKFLAYCVNVYMRPWIYNYLFDNGAKNIDGNMYALSVLIQWIFRSAIRKGEEIWIYVPSCRMRVLLHTWLVNLANGEDLRPIDVDIQGTMNKKKNKASAIPSLPFRLPKNYGKTNKTKKEGKLK